ncbi:unnamed protein product [marine sediment metagenome]|uniref:Uncharacterized protein n=1 Tax=marine sediment metagenome TaxID=412755 RepID=X1RYV1_9ZZZZ
MNIPKAIRTLTKWNEEGFVATSDDLLNAENLGIEALKRIEYCRSGHFNEIFKLLPGETEDNSEEAQEIEPEATYP